MFSQKPSHAGGSSVGLVGAITHALTWWRLPPDGALDHESRESERVRRQARDAVARAQDAIAKIRAAEEEERRGERRGG